MSPIATSDQAMPSEKTPAVLQLLSELSPASTPTSFRLPFLVREFPDPVQAGKLKSREDVVKGLSAFPDALLKLFKGENTGKLMLELPDA